MSKILNDILNTKKAAECFKSSLVYPIFKRGDKTQIKNYRCIACADHLLKIIENMFTAIIEEEIDNKISPLQKAFIKGRGIYEV